MHKQFSDAAPGTAVVSTEALLDRIVHRSPVGMAVIDHEGLFRVVNPAYGTIFGFQPEELLGRSFLTLLPPGEKARVLALHRRYLKAGGELKGEVDVVRSDGTAGRVLAESVRLQGDEGRPLRLVYVVDITERRQSELSLKSQRQFLQSVLDGMGAEICVVDERGVIVKVNHAWRKFGLRNGGADGSAGVGTDYLQVCERAAGSRDATASVAAHFAELLRTVLNGQRSHFELEYPCHGPTQRRWFVARVSRIEGSRPARIVITHDDVSALKRTQETLRENEALLSDLTASVPGAVFRLAADDTGSLRLLYLSAGVQPLLGVHADEVLHDVGLWWACILPEDRPAHDASLRQAVAGAAVWEHVYRVRVAGAEAEKWIRVHTGPPRRAQAALIFTGVLTDISLRMRAETALRASEETYRTLFETVAQGVVYQDTAGRITAANPAAQRILGLTLAQLQGLDSMDPRWRATREDGSPFPGSEHPAMEALRTGLPVKDVVMGIDVPGRETAWILISAMPLIKQGVVEGVYASFEDISQRVLLGRELQHQAHTDDLTGVHNRRSLLEHLGHEFERVRRHPALHCCLLALDLDHFKAVNDQWGHATGDAVLVHVARQMQKSVRTLDRVGRTGGEEFVVLLPDTNLQEAARLGERLRERMASTPLQQDGHSIVVTVSLGLSNISPLDASADLALRRADAALYEAKEAGRNRLCVRPAATDSAPAAR